MSEYIMPMSTCDKCGRRAQSAPPGYIHKCLCSGGIMRPEALTAPNEDAKLDGWTISGALSLIRAMSPDELAKHGITLAPEKDWATELWADLFAVRGMPSAAKSTREGRLDDEDQAAIALIRERVVLKGEG